MKHLFLLILCILSIGCVAPELKKCKMMPIKGRVTFYSSGESKWGSRISSSNRRAMEGRTCAISPREYSYGQKALIPYFHNYFNNNNLWIFEDCGSAPISRKASRGKFPIFDIYVNSRRKMNELAARTPELLDIYILDR